MGKAKIPTFPGYNQTVQEVPPGNGNGAHIHKSTEIFLFLDGTWEIGYGFDASEKEVLKGGDLIVVPAYECRTYTNIGTGLLQGIQVLNTRDTTLIERVEGVSEAEIRLEGVQEGCNTFLVVKSEGSMEE